MGRGLATTAVLITAAACAFLARPGSSWGGEPPAEGGWEAEQLIAVLEQGGFDERHNAAEEIQHSRRLKQWGRRRHLEFRLATHPLDITASAQRKVEWFGWGGMILVSLPLLCCPLLLRTRWGCGLWYRRPPAP
jgi:hypothetical protein